MARFIKLSPIGISINVQQNAIPIQNNTSASGILIKNQIAADKTTPVNFNAT